MGVENPGTQRRSEQIALRHVPGLLICIGLTRAIHPHHGAPWASPMPGRPRDLPSRLTISLLDILAVVCHPCVAMYQPGADARAKLTVPAGGVSRGVVAPAPSRPAMWLEDSKETPDYLVLK